MVTGVLIVSSLFVVYALVSRWLGRSMVTGPILFTVAGLAVAADLLGSGTALEAFAVRLDSDTIQLLLEATLVIVLFSDAVMIDVRAVRREAFLPSRLLGIGFPLTVVAGSAAAAVLFPSVGFWGAAVIAIVLAPTDAALGQAVVSNDDVPGVVRQGLGVESGLNDGLAVPFLTIAVAGVANEMQTAGHIAVVFVEEIGFAIGAGLAVGLAGGYLLRIASDRRLTGREGRRVLVVFLAISSYALADMFGGSGFIAAFVGGLAFGALTRHRFPTIHHFSEGVGHLLTMASFFVFGALMLGPVLEFVTLRMILYALLSLTVIRFIPVWISLIGTGLRPPTKSFIGWFGPRGLASLVFLGTIVAEASFPGTELVFGIGVVTVGLSVLLHGLTAWPASQRYAAWYNTKDDSSMMEAQDVDPAAFRRSKDIRLMDDDPM